jgi:putative MFS transporter
VIAAGWAASLLVIGFVVSPAIIMVFGLIASATIGLVIPLLYTYTAEHFTTTARASGIALTDGLGHLGGALAPVFVLSALNLRGFTGAFDVMAATGIVAALLALLGIRATRRSLETVTATA